MNEELYALQSQGTWTLFPPVPHTMPVGSKWGFQVKYNSDGSVGRYKVRLVAKGFLQRPGFGLIIYLIMYVDDIIITGNNSHHVEDFVTRLGRRFSIKDLGGLNFFLGVEVVRTPTGLFLTQQKYIYEIVEQTNMNDAKPMRTPTASGSCPRLDNGSPLNDPKEYQNIVGSLQYLLLTRPDVAFIVNKLSQFTSSPTTAHWALVKRVLRYLAGTSDLGIYLRKSNRDDRSSTTAYIVFLGCNPVSWSSKKQRAVARSSTEAIASATADLCWVKNLLQELSVTLHQPPVIYCDNLGATYVCANPDFHSRMKHIEIDYHFVRSLVQRGLLRVSHVSSKEQLADLLTKPLSNQDFERLRSKIGISSRATILRGHISDTLIDHISVIHSD
ncbi:PREDICTED: uncharacterized protein LOC109240184 [Nicotiana attenuata]|uniref:uncharacterized protein LOC109240184 n=1 Tax=Nicotiana attenuata TaxID=49451 RepID=UPI000905BCCC|nr:PREDICTED: uncharacterized protein LOC109240184 [Nicotiana attenuata]